MSSSWLKDFENRLGDIQSRRNNSPASLIDEVARVQLAPDFDISSFMLNKTPNSVSEHLLDWGGRALDVISRPGYAVGGFLNDFIRDAGPTPDDTNPLGHLREGFLGREKEFFSPFKMADPYEEGESGLKTGARFITDFLASIAADPITWVPGGVYAKGARIAGDALGVTNAFSKVASHVKPQNTVKMAEDVLPSFDEIQDASDAALPITGTARPTDIPNVMPQGEFFPAPLPKTSPVPDAAGPVGDKAIPGQQAFPLEQFLPFEQGPLPNPNAAKDLERALGFTGNMRRVAGDTDANRLSIYTMVRESITDSLKNVKGKFNSSSIKSPWVEEGLPPIQQFSMPATREVVEELPKVPYEASQRLNTIIRTLRDAAFTAEKGKGKAMSRKMVDKDIYEPSTNTFWYNGDEADIPRWAKEEGLLDDPAKFEQFISNRKTEVFRGRTPERMPLSSYAAAFDDFGKENAAMDAGLEGLSVLKQGEKVPFKDYVQSRRAKWKGKEKGGTRTRIEQLPPAAPAAPAALKRKKPTLKEVEELLRTNKIVLSTAEKRKLVNMVNLGNEKGFMNAMKAFSDAERKLSIENLKELEAAVKSGRVQPEVLQGILDKLGAKTIRQAETKLRQLDDKIAELSAKEAQRLFDNPPEEFTPLNKQSFDPDVIGDIPHAIPDPKVPIHEKVDNISEDLAEAAIDEVVSPNIAANLTPQDKKTLWESMRRVVTDQARRRSHKTGKGAQTDTPGLYQGSNDTRWAGEWNEKAQYNNFKDLLSRVRRMAKEANLPDTGADFDNFKYDKIMSMLKAQDEVLRSYGVHPSSGVGGRGYPLSLFDILSALPRQHVINHLFNPGRQITPSQYIELGNHAMTVKLGGMVDNPFEGGVTFVTSDLSDWRDFVRGTLGKRFSDDRMAGKSAYQYAEEQAGKAAKRWEKKATGNVEAGSKVVRQYKQDQMFGNVPKNPSGSIHPLLQEDFIKAIQEKVRYNSERAKIQYGQFVKRNADKQVDAFKQAVAGAKTDSEVFKIIDEANGTVTEQLAKDAIIPPVGSINELKDIVEEATSNVTTAVSKKQAQANGRSRSANDRVQNGVRQGEAISDLAVRMSPTADLSEHTVMTLLGKMVHAVAPHIPEGSLRSLMLNKNVTAAQLAAHYSMSLSNFERRVGKDKIKQLFEDVRQGHVPNAEDLTDYREMQSVMNRVFDLNDTYGIMARNGIEPAHLNSNLRHFQINERFKLKGNDRDAAYGSWRDWENVDDPFDLMSRYSAAVYRTLAEKSFGEELVRNFASDVPRKGYVRVSSTGGSKMFHLVDNTKWYPKEITDNMRAMDKTLAELARPGTSNRLLRLFDSATHAYKTGLTIYRPGHHLRNLYGDIWLSAMDGVYSPRYYNQALKVMATRNSHYKDYDFNFAIGDLAKNNGAHALTVKGMHLTNDDVYRLAMKHGVLPDYKTIEDLGVGSVGNTGDVLDKIGGFKPFGGKVHKAASEVSEFRDHYARMAHFLKAMEDSASKVKFGGSSRADKLRALDEMAMLATNRVRKWHPNGADLTQFERNVARRGILFYSWIRKAIPLVVETAATRPGRFLAFPKAMYSLAESNGIDLNGFTDPFPTDQLFPQWLGGNQGPQFGNASDGYLGIRPGVPMMDVLDQYFTSPGETFQTVMGATHPFIKVPYELTTGANTQGVPINDTSKYLLGQVPFGNFVNTMLGKPIGGVSPTDEGYEPGGIRDPKTIAFINMMTGVGLMDMSKPSYIKSGEFDIKYGRQEGN